MNEPARTGHQYRVLVGLVVGQVVFAAVFVFLLLSAYHQPTPHALPVGVAAPQAVTRQLQAALDAPDPGGIGSFQALTGAFGTVAAKTGQHLSVIDVVPPLREDSEAFSVFFVILGVLFPSLVAGIASSLVLRRSPSTWRVAVLVVVAAMIGLVAAAIADGVTGFGHLLAIAGTVALFSLAISAPAALARSKLTPAIPAFLGFVVLGIPVSGGLGALAPFSPRFLRVLDPALPLGVAVDALRSTVYRFVNK